MKFACTGINRNSDHKLKLNLHECDKHKVTRSYDRYIIWNIKVLFHQLLIVFIPKVSRTFSGIETQSITIQHCVFICVCMKWECQSYWVMCTQGWRDQNTRQSSTTSRTGSLLQVRKDTHQEKYFENRRQSFTISPSLIPLCFLFLNPILYSCKILVYGTWHVNILLLCLHS